MKIVCVCSKCRHHEHEAVMEFNFADEKIYWICPECQAENKLDFENKNKLAPLPKTARLRQRR